MYNTYIYSLLFITHTYTHTHKYIYIYIYIYIYNRLYEKYKYMSNVYYISPFLNVITFI